MSSSSLTLDTFASSNRSSNRGISLLNKSGRKPLRLNLISPFLGSLGKQPTISFDRMPRVCTMYTEKCRNNNKIATIVNWLGWYTVLLHTYLFDYDRLAFIFLLVDIDVRIMDTVSSTLPTVFAKTKYTCRRFRRNLWCLIVCYALMF